MKKIFALIGLVILTSSCTVNDTNELDNSTTESWELISIENPSNSQSNSILNISEQLILQNDSIFTRTRQTNSNSWVLNGTYNYMTVDKTKYLVFHYNKESDLIGNCSNNKNEVFIFDSNNEIINTWFECGGPKLKYRKFE